MYLHVITSGIRNITCTWQENIDLVQDMIIIGGHLYLKCNFNRVCLNCSLILWLNYSLLQLINLQNDLIKNTYSVVHGAAKKLVITNISKKCEKA